MTPRTLPPIRQAATRDDFAQARALFEEYAAWLDVDLCFQGFDQELASLPGAYAAPRGMLVLAGTKDAAAGCVALRPLPGESERDGGVAEIKRLYVRPVARGTGLGMRLAQTVIDGARVIGYRELKLDKNPPRTFYARHGDVFCVTLLVIAGCAIAFAMWRQRSGAR